MVVMVRSVIKGVAVIFGALIITTFTIDATDSFRTSNTALSILTSNAVEAGCPDGTTLIALSDGDLCVDTYENSASAACPHQQVRSFIASDENIAADECQAVSVKEQLPWAFVTYHQAKALCAAKGMRLPTHREWYEAGIGTTDTDCNVDGSVRPAGMTSSCQSSYGIYDAVGNVWEWVDGAVTNGQYADRPYPVEGYVVDVDFSGVPTETSASPSALYEADYTWSAASGTYVMMRGGYFGSGSDAGLFAVHANVTPSFASAATGFRCVKRR